MPHKAKRDPLGVHQTGTLFSRFLAGTSTKTVAHKSLQTFKKPKLWRIGHLQLLKKSPRGRLFFTVLKKVGNFITFFGHFGISWNQRSISGIEKNLESRSSKSKRISKCMSCQLIDVKAGLRLEMLLA